MSEQSVEAEIQAKGLNAPRLTPQLIDHQIVTERYVRASDIEPGLLGDKEHWQSLSCLTICVLVLRNGFTIVGKSACASPENFDEALGQKIAREDARRQIWALEGYLLRTKLTEGW